jgi:hypothetical protein
MVGIAAEKAMAKRKREMGTTEMMLYTDRRSVERILGPSATEELELYFNLEKFWNGARQDFIDDTYTGLQALQVAQYPLTEAFTDPAALSHIKDVHEMNAQGLICTCRQLIEDMHKGMDLHAKYPKLEEWRAFYCNPEQPQVLGPEDVHRLPGDTEETIRQRVEKENAEMRAWHEEKMSMKDAYFDLMQPLLFQHLPGLQDLEGDHWVIYAVTIRDAYEEWKSLCEEMDTTIELGMPQESITWEHAERQALISEKFREKLAKRI